MDNISSKIDLLKTLKILYIEDEIKIQKEITKTLTLLCSEVFSFSNAEEAYDFFLSNKVDIIISDVTLEQMDGLEFSKKIRQINKTIPIIIISAHTDTSYLLNASKLKLVEYLVKPITFAKLQQTLFNACDELKEKNINKIQFKNGLIFDIKQKQIFDNEKAIKLTSNELKFLNLLSKKSTPTTNEDIKNHIWDDPYDASDLAFKSLIHKLRKKIGKDTIKNSSGIGYFLD